MKHTPHHAIPPMQPAGYTALCNLAKLGKGKTSISVPVKTLRQMLRAYEDMLDILAFDEAKKRGAETFPTELVDRLIAGENRLRIYREYRGLTQAALASASGVSRAMIAMIETDKKTGSVTTIKKLARALAVELEDLA